MNAEYPALQKGNRSASLRGRFLRRGCHHNSPPEVNARKDDSFANNAIMPSRTSGSRQARMHVRPAA